MKIRHVLIMVVFLLCASVVGGLAQQNMPSQPRSRHRMGPPPPMSSVCTDGKYLFVVIGPKIHVYTVPDLTLKKTAELPRPTPNRKR